MEFIPGKNCTSNFEQIQENLLRNVFVYIFELALRNNNVIYLMKITH